MTGEAVRWRPYRTLDDIEAFAVDLSPDPEWEAAALDLLDPSERTRHRRFLVEEARRQFLLSRAALRMLLGRRLGCPPAALGFASETYGKPYAVIDGRRAPISFNLSHSGGDALIALTASRSVGIDLEQRKARDDLDGIAASVFGARERAALASLTGPGKLALFYRLWTCKEALIKAKGTGFSEDPARFEVPEPILAGGQHAPFGFPGENAPHWVLADLGGDAYAAAIAYRR